MTPEEMYMRECALARVMGATEESGNYGWGATIAPPSAVQNQRSSAHPSASVHLSAPRGSIAAHMTAPSHPSAPRGSIAAHLMAPGHLSAPGGIHPSAPIAPHMPMGIHPMAPMAPHMPTGIHSMTPMALTGYISPPTGRSYIAPPTGRYIAPPTGRFAPPPPPQSHSWFHRGAPPPPLAANQYQPVDDYVPQHHHHHRHHPHMPPTEQPYYPDAEDVEPTYSQPPTPAYDTAPQGYDDSSVDSNEEVYDDSVQVDDGSDVGFGMHWAVPFGAGVVAHSLYLNRWY